jgi:hypothetical protein
MPVTMVLIYVLSTRQGAPPFWENPARMNGWTHSPVFSSRRGRRSSRSSDRRRRFARDQKLTFALERSELERQALDARLHLLLKELLERLDARQFAQVHRSVVVNLRAISHVKRHNNQTAEIHLKRRDDVLPVSRNYLHLFRQM